MLSALTALAQDFCYGDFNYDGQVMVDDLQKICEDFGRNKFSNPCPPDGPAPVPKTGNTIDDTTGEDGDFKKGVEWPNPRFKDNGDYTVTDNLTGLMWTKDAYLTQDDWTGAIDYVADMNASTEPNYGYTDWRLPNVKELSSLIDFSQYDPALPYGHPFTNVQSFYCWSATTYVVYFDDAWRVYISNAVVYNLNKSNSFYVWPVRGGR